MPLTVFHCHTVPIENVWQRGRGGGGQKSIYIKPPLFGVFLVSPPPGYQDQGYLAWFSPDLLYSH